MINGRAIEILLVEDDPAHAEIVRRNLSETRVANHITHLTDGQAALDYLVGQSGRPPAKPLPDLILLDLRLPKVDGQEVLKRLKAHDPLRRIPIVILTTSKAELDMVAAYGNGAGSYLVKPVDFAKFTALMEAFGFYWLAWNEYPHPTQPAR
jgi:two-component system, response regulator